MPREYPPTVSCPNCGETATRHCVTNPRCGWFWCLNDQLMIVLGPKNPVSRKWAVVKTMRWPFPR